MGNGWQEVEIEAREFCQTGLRYDYISQLLDYAIRDDRTLQIVVLVCEQSFLSSSDDICLDGINGIANIYPPHASRRLASRM